MHAPGLLGEAVAHILGVLQDMTAHGAQESAYLPILFWERTRAVIETRAEPQWGQVTSPPAESFS